MKSLFSYTDYREYLRDYYSFMKESTSYFSYRYFAQKADIKSPVFLKLVIEGSRNLTEETRQKFTSAIGFEEKEERFFHTLVKYNQAKTDEEKQEYYAALLTMNEYVHEESLTSLQLAYYTQWYYSAVRELITLYPFGDNFEQLASSVKPTITIVQARRAVKLLLDLKLIERSGDTYNQTQQSITGGNDTMNMARRSHNSDMIQVAKQANETISPSERNISGLTLGISPETYDILVDELQQFKERIKTIVAGDDNSSQVYQMNFQLFPLSENIERNSDETTD